MNPGSQPASRLSWLPPAIWRSGIGILAISLLIFVLSELFGKQNNERASIFFLLHLISIGYMIAISVNAKRREPALRLHCRYLMLVIFLVAAYGLNRDFNVFDESTPWLCVALTLSCIAGLSMPLLPRLPGWIRQLVIGLNAAACLLWLYLTVFLLHLFPISVLVLIAFGISIYTFVPLFLLIATISMLVRELRTAPGLTRGLIAGLALALTPTVVFCIQWGTVNRSIRAAQAEARISQSALPAWTLIAQRIPENFATEACLKATLVYTMLDYDDFGWRMPSRSFSEPRRHDPLVSIAAIFSAPSGFPHEDLLHILDVRYDARHKTEERLWSGAHLRTASVSTQLQVWPAQRIAYQEQTIVVKNSGRGTFWDRGDEEALYTMQLPEGSAVTSLSLWIDGREEKARLSSRGKADTAYRNIVGVERRDPSLVRWMEGNRVTVRVFPVPAGGERQFKIGVTTPLQSFNGRLQFEPLRFDGPDARDASSATKVRMEGDASALSGLTDFDQVQPGIYEYSGTYREHHISMAAPAVGNSKFSFNGNTYSLSETAPQRQSFLPRKIYLDLNAAWSYSEYRELCSKLKDFPLYAGLDYPQQINPANMKSIFNRTSGAGFSLFPLFEINSPRDALIITKSPARGPNLADLEGSGFAAKLSNAVKRKIRYQVFNLDSEPSPYLKSLRERRLLNYESGGLRDLQKLIDERQFAGDAETPNSVVIGESGIRITKSPGEVFTKGPDHLLRLYNYNDIIRQLGTNMFGKMESDSALQRTADEAYVVSPVSSLIVLETQEDYTRHGIKPPTSAATSLGNAQIGNSGAVPEPHEWALIIVGIFTLAWLKREALLRRLKIRQS